MTDVYIYDKAKWHSEGDEYPAGLPEQSAYTHGGFLLAWLLKNKLLSQSFHDDHADAARQFIAGKLTPGEFNAAVDGVLDSSMLNDEGNAFVTDYVDECYLEDYEMLFEDDYDHAYAVEDTPANGKKVARLLTDCLKEWKAAMRDG